MPDIGSVHYNEDAQTTDHFRAVLDVLSDAWVICLYIEPIRLDRKEICIHKYDCRWRGEQMWVLYNRLVACYEDSKAPCGIRCVEMIAEMRWWNMMRWLNECMGEWVNGWMGERVKFGFKPARTVSQPVTWPILKDLPILPFVHCPSEAFQPQLGNDWAPVLGPVLLVFERTLYMYIQYCTEELRLCCPTTPVLVLVSPFIQSLLFGSSSSSTSSSCVQYSKATINPILVIIHFHQHHHIDHHHVLYHHLQSLCDHPHLPPITNKFYMSLCFPLSSPLNMWCLSLWCLFFFCSLFCVSS